MKKKVPKPSKSRQKQHKIGKRRLKIRARKRAREEGLSPLVKKYWLQRYDLFSKYDQGIKMDEEGWFSVTPEEIAVRHAVRSGGGVVIDCFAGVGGNAIQFAKILMALIFDKAEKPHMSYAALHNKFYKTVYEARVFKKWYRTSTGYLPGAGTRTRYAEYMPGMENIFGYVVGMARGVGYALSLVGCSDWTSTVAGVAIGAVLLDVACMVGAKSTNFQEVYHGVLWCYHVVAIDIDPQKVELAFNNAKIYGVEDYIDFIVGDFFQLSRTLKGDVAFLSPPWGGPSYKTIGNFTLDLLKPKDGYSLFQIAQAITPNIVMFLPRHVDLHQVEELSWLSSPPLCVEIEESYVKSNLKGITVYFGGAAFGQLGLDY
ncbi:hypothetical protein TEA_029870 [Camellia sinensis var. sinensis]|uniref:Trimethylguanosine synthase n=1 Tax=Camellia sinensis var. sinensis TaxID=542762 RepID=A0A4S4EWR7_CAMSN|nr:hypothetical protein TEA_029870 [Camellia sinensis var. sinensis]